MHEHNTAHLDIGHRDILMNFSGVLGRWEWYQAVKSPLPFRSRLSSPCRYTFIDFEAGAIFPYTSPQQTHRRSGVHFHRSGRLFEPEDYGKVGENARPSAVCHKYTRLNGNSCLFSTCLLNGLLLRIFASTKATSIKLVVFGKNTCG